MPKFLEPVRVYFVLFQTRKVCRTRFQRTRCISRLERKAEPNFTMVHACFSLPVGTLRYISHVSLASFLLQMVALWPIHSRSCLYFRLVEHMVKHIWICLPRSQSTNWYRCRRNEVERMQTNDHSTKTLPITNLTRTNTEGFFSHYFISSSISRPGFDHFQLCIFQFVLWHWLSHMAIHWYSTLWSYQHYI